MVSCFSKLIYFLTTLAWFFYKENRHAVLNDGTFDFTPLFDNAINQKSSCIPFHQNKKVFYSVQPI